MVQLLKTKENNEMGIILKIILKLSKTKVIIYSNTNFYFIKATGEKGDRKVKNRVGLFSESS